MRGEAIKEIVRELKGSRKVVRKLIRSGETSFRHKRSPQPVPRIDPWRNDLDRLLLANGDKPTRERLTRTRIFETLRGLGDKDGDDAVRRYAGSWSRERSAVTAHVPLCFAWDEA